MNDSHETAAHPDDLFHVVPISNHDHLAGNQDPVSVFFTTAVEYGEGLVRQGLHHPDIVQVPTEVYSLSFSHRNDFPRYGVVSEPPRSGADLQYMRLYFFSDNALKLAQRMGVELPRVARTVTRTELPEHKGSPAPFGTKFWDRAS